MVREVEFMKLQTVASVWYEADQAKGFGAKLAGRFDNLAGCRKAIKESNMKAIKYGHPVDVYHIMRCSVVRLLDANNDVVSETITRVRA